MAEQNLCIPFLGTLDELHLFCHSERGFKASWIHDERPKASSAYPLLSWMPGQPLVGWIYSEMWATSHQQQQPASRWLPAEQGFAEPKYKQYIGYYECAWILVIQLRIYIIWHSCFFIPRSVCTSTSFLCFEASLSKCLCSVSLMISFSWIPVPLVFWYPSSISISDEERMVVGASVFSHVQYNHFYLWLYGWWSIFL